MKVCQTHTTRDIARLIIPGKVAEVKVFEPRYPDVVLFVVLVLGPVHPVLSDSGILVEVES